MSRGDFGEEGINREEAKGAKKPNGEKRRGNG
jgi:hypothetical protein